MDRPDYDAYRNKFIRKCKKTRNDQGKKKSRLTCEKEFNNS